MGFKARFCSKIRPVSVEIFAANHRLDLAVRSTFVSLQRNLTVAMMTMEGGNNALCAYIHDGNL